MHAAWLLRSTSVSFVPHNTRLRDGEQPRVNGVTALGNHFSWTYTSAAFGNGS